MKKSKPSQGQSPSSNEGVVDWLVSCPEKGLFTPIESESTRALWTREIEVGIADLDAGRYVSHEEVAKWLGSWGTKGETKAPR